MPQKHSDDPAVTNDEMRLSWMRIDGLLQEFSDSVANLLCALSTRNRRLGAIPVERGEDVRIAPFRLLESKPLQFTVVTLSEALVVARIGGMVLGQFARRIHRPAKIADVDPVDRLASKSFTERDCLPEPCGR